MGVYTIMLPDVGEGIAEAELVEWNVAVGDTVREDDVLGTVMTDKAAVEVPSALFEVSGTRSAAGDAGLDRYWRDARTHTLHDPVRYKLHHLGRFTLNEERPPLHGVV